MGSSSGKEPFAWSQKERLTEDPRAEGWALLHPLPWTWVAGRCCLQVGTVPCPCTDCWSQAQKPHRRGQHRESLATELSLHWEMLCVSWSPGSKGRTTCWWAQDGGRTVSHLLRWANSVLPDLNVSSVACFSLLWQPGCSLSAPNHSKKYY